MECSGRKGLLLEQRTPLFLSILSISFITLIVSRLTYVFHHSVDYLPLECQSNSLVRMIPSGLRITMRSTPAQVHHVHTSSLFLPV